jgi:NTP pyrophosphatase (non-canonical NTP hydrolase)
MMKVSELYAFVEQTDESIALPVEQREQIATLGLISEIGSVLAALKKDILAPSDRNLAERVLVRGELREQIGDATWYAIMLAQRLDDPRAQNIFKSDIDMLHRQLSGRARNDRRVQEELGSERCTKFLAAAGLYLELDDPAVDIYQQTAFITRRTEGDQLRDICVAVLQQLAAQISRDFLPNKEMALNHEVRPKDPVDALGEIMWHLSALASLYSLSLSDILILTSEKASFRNPLNLSGPEHNGEGPSERFPDHFEVHFISREDRKSDMFWVDTVGAIKKLGATLTDNDHDGDGYRFHDVMHVAFAVHLRWSPNLRAFMGLKRRSVPATDEVEDGGRAKILEEAVILEIHLQAQDFEGRFRTAGKLIQGSPYNELDAIGFEFLRRLHELCRGHEVHQNPKQDWERAIREGYDCYYRLRAANGGIVVADMIERTLSFYPPRLDGRLEYPFDAVS